MTYVPRADRKIQERIVESFHKEKIGGDAHMRATGNAGIDLRIKQLQTHAMGSLRKKNLDNLLVGKKKRKSRVKKNIESGVRDAVENIKGDNLIDSLRGIGKSDN